MSIQWITQVFSLIYTYLLDSGLFVGKRSLMFEQQGRGCLNIHYQI